VEEAEGVPEQALEQEEAEQQEAFLWK